MPNLNAMFRDEIRRVARQELRQSVGTLKSTVAELKESVADLKKRCKDYEKQLGLSQAALAVRTPELSESPIPDEDIAKVRPTSHMIKDLRKKLGISQVEMASLLGVTSQSVSNWERKKGSLSLRNATKRALIRLRNMNKRDAVTRLTDIAGSSVATGTLASIIKPVEVSEESE